MRDFKFKTILIIALWLHIDAKCQVKFTEQLDLSNPGSFAGTDFGSFLQRLWINQDYAQMLDFTSQRSRKKFGDKQLLAYYQTFDFAYELRLKSKSIQGDTIWLNYKTKIQATDRVIRMPVLVEQDTVRVLILSISQKAFLID